MEIPDYEIIHKENCGGFARHRIEFANGTSADIKIPFHTPEEDEKFAEEITKASFQMLFPDKNYEGKRLIIIK